MGVFVAVSDRKISTLFRSSGQGTSVLNNLPVLNTPIDIIHSDFRTTTMRNNGNQPVNWKATFLGRYKKAKAGKKRLNLRLEKDRRGNDISYVEVKLNPGQEMEITVR